MENQTSSTQSKNQGEPCWVVNVLRSLDEERIRYVTKDTAYSLIKIPADPDGYFVVTITNRFCDPNDIDGFGVFEIFHKETGKTLLFYYPYPDEEHTSI